MALFHVRSTYFFSTLQVCLSPGPSSPPAVKPAPSLDDRPPARRTEYSAKSIKPCKFDVEFEANSRQQFSALAIYGEGYVPRAAEATAGVSRHVKSQLGILGASFFSVKSLQPSVFRSISCTRSSLNVQMAESRGRTPTTVASKFRTDIGTHFASAMAAAEKGVALRISSKKRVCPATHCTGGVHQNEIFAPRMFDSIVNVD